MYLSTTAFDGHAVCFRQPFDHPFKSWLKRESDQRDALSTVDGETLEVDIWERVTEDVLQGLSTIARAHLTQLVEAPCRDVGRVIDRLGERFTRKPITLQLDHDDTACAVNRQQIQRTRPSKNLPTDDL